MKISNMEKLPQEVSLFSETIAFIRANLANSIKVKDLADVVNLSENQFKLLFHVFVIGSGLLGFGALVLLALSGVIAPFTGRFYSLWDTSYAKKYIPIIASVSEHQPTAWPKFFFDLHMLIPLLPAGVFLCFKQLKDEVCGAFI